MNSSIIPPGVPIPDPPRANLLAKIQVFFVGFVLLLYLIYNISLEVIDWKNFRNPKERAISESDNEIPPSLSAMFAHPVASDPKRCLECHDLADDTLEILPGLFWGDQVCMECHPLKDFDGQHRGHKFEPFEYCTTCHSPHKSIEKPLMKNTYEKTCTLCHPYPNEK